MTLNGKEVGSGTVVEGKMLHGKSIPQDHTKLIIDSIKPNTKAVFITSFDDDVILCGQFVAWPNCGLFS